jgi:hypothetical protein
MSEQTAGVPTEYLRLPEAAAYIRMSTQFLRKAHRTGRGPDRLRVGKCLLFTKTALDTWLSARAEAPAAR